MEFLADENVPRPVIARLRSDGIAVKSIAEISAGSPDVDVLATADQGNFILITQDQDFGELAILRQMPVSGVLLLKLGRLPLSAPVETISQLVQANIAILAGNLTVVEPSRTRVRPLPPKKC